MAGSAAPAWRARLLMRATSSCVNHPSHEATVRCRGCAAWLCDRCIRTWGDRAYCGQICRLRVALRQAAEHLSRLAAARIHPAAAVAISAALCALLLSVIGTLVATLLEVSREAQLAGSAAAAMAPLYGRIETDAGGSRMLVRGPADRSVLVLENGRPVAVVELDGLGNAELPGTIDGHPRASVELVLLASGRVPVDFPEPPTATASPTTSATSSPTASPSRTPSATATPPPHPTPRRATTTPAVTTRRLSSADRRTIREGPPVLHRVPDAGPRLALTFDGGHNADGSAELLEVLERLEMRATIFLTGKFIERYPALVRQALLAGHEIGNHTYSHDHLTSYADNRRHDPLPHVTRDWLHDELTRTEQAFTVATGRVMAPLWRAPYGEENALVRGWAMELGYLHVRWSSLSGASLDSLDWVNDEHSSLYRSSADMFDRLLGFPELEGGIVLMHLASGRPEPPWTDLPRFVAALEQRGIATVQVSELLSRSPTWRGWLERARVRHRTAFPEPGSSP